MASVSEAIGLAVPGSAGLPAHYDARDDFAHKAGLTVMDLLDRAIRPRDILTGQAFENAASIVAASGGAACAALHLPAIAHECGIDFDLTAIGYVWRRTPRLADLRPGGTCLVRGLHDAGGTPALMRAMLNAGADLLSHLQLDYHSQLVRDAVYKTVNEDQLHTEDLGGQATSMDVVQNVINHIKLAAK